MLSDRERETLREIQRQFMVEDPELARSFREIDRPQPRDHLRQAYTVTMVVAMVFGFLVLVAGSPAGALGCGILAGLIWLARRHRDELSQRKP